MFGFGFRRGFTGEHKMTDSQQLLAGYAETGSERAFRELVGRYVNLVYSTALRRVAGDTQLAEDVVQTVFIGLARRGRSLTSGVMLGGWLHQYACHTAAKAMRGERRRQAREQEAVEMKNYDKAQSRDPQRRGRCRRRDVFGGSTPKRTQPSAGKPGSSGANRPAPNGPCEPVQSRCASRGLALPEQRPVARVAETAERSRFAPAAGARGSIRPAPQARPERPHRPARRR